MGRHLVFLLTSWLLSTCTSYEIHKHMTLDEVRNTFHVDAHHLVPEYEVVPIHHVRRRSTPDYTENLIDSNDWLKRSKTPYENKILDSSENGLRLKAFGKPFSLTLIPTEGLLKKGKLKIWTIEPNATAQHGVEYVEMPETTEEIGELYQDQENEAAILVRKENEGLVVEGSIGSQLVIRPLPIRLRNNVTLLNQTKAGGITDDEMFLDQDGELSAEVAIDTGLPINRRNKDVHHHIVYKTKDSEQKESLSDYAFMEPDHMGKRYKRSTSSKSSRSKREAPYTIYPEVLVIVDYDGYRLHGGDNAQIKRYFVSFWNGVDMRYKLLKGPKIRISIAGIIISRGRDATPYLERNRVGRDAIDSAAALTDMGKYLFRERRLPVYDIAVAITKLDMCRRSYPNDACNRGTAALGGGLPKYLGGGGSVIKKIPNQLNANQNLLLGFAYVGGACVVNKRLEKVNSVAIIEDTGGFSGIIVAAHEVGHLLGAVHDGSPPPSYLGGPGAEKCQWTDGYIMSDLRHTERGFRWSPCSVASFHHFLNGDTATCLYNTPHEDENLARVLPGKLLTLDAQCRRDRGTSACFKDDRVCAQLFCFDSGSGYCVAYRPAAEGSPCGDGQTCTNGRCVAEHENIIPDYTQNSPSYIRGSGNQGRPLFHEEEEEALNLNPIQPYNYYNADTTQPPYENPLPPQYYQYQNNPYDFQSNQYPYSLQTQDFSGSSDVTSQAPVSTTTRYTFRPLNLFTFSTTKSPYDFKNFGKKSTTSPTPTPSPIDYQTNPVSTYTTSTISPFLNSLNNFRRQTTKNPYDFANFGKMTQSQYADNNHLKRSYNAASYYTDSSNITETVLKGTPVVGYRYYQIRPSSGAKAPR